MTVTFYMRGAHAVEVFGVKDLEMTKRADGAYSGYSLTWMTGHAPAFFSLSLNDIVAVTSKPDPVPSLGFWGRFLRKVRGK